MVRVRVPPHLLRLPTAHGQDICTSHSIPLDSLLIHSTTDLFLCQMDLHHSHRNFRDRLNHLRRRPYLSRLHSRTRYRRHRQRWHLHGRNGHLCRLDPVAEPA